MKSDPVRFLPKCLSARAEESSPREGGLLFIYRFQFSSGGKKSLSRKTNRERGDDEEDDDRDDEDGDPRWERKEIDLEIPSTRSPIQISKSISAPSSARSRVARTATDSTSGGEKPMYLPIH